MSSFMDWYYPQPVTTTAEQEVDITKLADTGVTPDTSAGRRPEDTGREVDGIATFSGKNKSGNNKINIGDLTYVNPVTQLGKHASFNDYLTSAGLPARDGFFSPTDFSSLPQKSNTIGKVALGTAAFTSNLLAAGAISAVGAILGPTEKVADPTGTSYRTIHQGDNIFNRLASMKIAEEYKDLNAIHKASIDNPANAVTAGYIMHVNGRPIYRMPGEKRWKHNIPNLGDISVTQGNNLHKLVEATTYANMIPHIGSDQDFIDLQNKTGITDNNPTFVRTTNGGYNLSGSFNFGGTTMASMGLEQDAIDLGQTFFGHISNAASQRTYADEVIEGLRGLPSDATAKERMDFINSVVQRSKTTSTPPSLLRPTATPATSKTPTTTGGGTPSPQDAAATASQRELERVQKEQRESGGDRDVGAFDRSAGGAGGSYGLSHAMGGQVPGDQILTANEVLEGQESGFIQAPPSQVSEADTVADDVPMNGDVGGEIINASAVTQAGEADIAKMISDAERYARENGIEISEDGDEKSNIRVSKGEVYIKPELADIIGRDKIRKINNRGKPDTKRKLKQTQQVAEGGFIKKKFAEGDEVTDVGEDIPMQDFLPVSDELKAKIARFGDRKPQREQIKAFIRSLSPEEKLTVLFLTETKSSTDPLEGMEAIGEVVNNRIKSNYYDFANIKTLDDALLKQTRRGAFQFSGLEPTTFFNRAKEVKKGLADRGLARANAAAQNVLSPEREGANRLDSNTLFYTRVDAPSQWMRESKDLEFSTELGEHEFYRTFASPEFP